MADPKGKAPKSRKPSPDKKQADPAPKARPANLIKIPQPAIRRTPVGQ